MRLLKWGVVVGIGYYAYQKLKSLNDGDVYSDHGSVGSSGIVRNAGPEDQHGIDNQNWDTVDQQVDESFPASDPPANY